MLNLRGRIPIGRLVHLFNLQGGLCYYCLREAWLPDTETLDAFAERHGIFWQEASKYRLATREHLIKRQDGGTNQIFNVVMACAWCNNQRGDRSVLGHVKFCRQHFHGPTMAPAPDMASDDGTPTSPFTASAPD